MLSVPVIAKATAIPAPVATNLTAQVLATAKRTPSPRGLGIPTSCKEINVCQPKLKESSPAADVPASTFEKLGTILLLQCSTQIARKPKC